jgi:hypothetical protein
MDCGSFCNALLRYQGCNALRVGTQTIGDHPEAYTPITYTQAGPGDIILQPGRPHGHFGQIVSPVGADGNWQAIDFGTRFKRTTGGNPSVGTWGNGQRAWFHGHLSSFLYYRPQRR